MLIGQWNVYDGYTKQIMSEYEYTEIGDVRVQVYGNWCQSTHIQKLMMSEYTFAEINDIRVHIYTEIDDVSVQVCRN